MEYLVFNIIQKVIIKYPIEFSFGLKTIIPKSYLHLYSDVIPWPSPALNKDIYQVLRLVSIGLGLECEVLGRVGNKVKYIGSWLFLLGWPWFTIAYSKRTKSHLAQRSFFFRSLIFSIQNDFSSIIKIHFLYLNQCSSNLIRFLLFSEHRVVSSKCNQ